MKPISIIKLTTAIVALVSLAACGSEGQVQSQPTVSANDATATARQIIVQTVLAMPDPTEAPEGDCPPVPATQNMSLTPVCQEVKGANLNIKYEIEATGFKAGESISFKIANPDGDVLDESDSQAREDGKYVVAGSYSSNRYPTTGIYTISLEGKDSGQKATGHIYYKSIP